MKGNFVVRFDVCMKQFVPYKLMSHKPSIPHHKERVEKKSVENKIINPSDFRANV